MLRGVFWRAVERELARHAEFSLDLIATANFDGYFTRVNPAFTRTLGWEAEEFVSRPFLDFVHSDDQEPTLKAVADQTVAGREVLNFQNRYQASDGCYRWLEWTSRPDPHARTLIAVARDITDRKRFEEREREYHRLLEQAVAERTSELERRTLELQEAQIETLLRLARAAELHDGSTAHHNERVARTSARIAARLGLPAEEVELIAQAGLLHDVGKIAVSDVLLLKRSGLTPDEFEQVKWHAAAGAAILAGSNSAVLRMAEEIARSHHEWWDGTGYPHGLAGEDIPLPGRIVAVADVFDAITNARPYKPARPLEHALREIESLSGRQFDPQTVGAFLDLHARQRARSDRRLVAVA
jgi:PAS domain S-box-containing protein